ncbi:MAG: polysaccharide deacetylase family protein [Clostridiales bacterium]|nr:polysaccharide deacetylase family protein [Clostridiales bacterium]
MRIIYITRRKTAKILLVFCLVLISVAYFLNLRDSSVAVFLNSKRELPIYCVERDDKKISISFDAAWGTEYTDDILKILEERKIKCTFFLVGFWVDAHPDKVQLIARMGHEIGNHSTNHPHMSNLSREDIIREIETTQEKIVELAASKAVQLIRPPFGDYNNLLINTCREIDFYPIQWDVDSLDWKELGVDHMFKQVTEKVKPGSIVLFHNNAKYIADALPIILDRLIDEGYEFVPISELIYKDSYDIDHTGMQRKAGV